MKHSGTTRIKTQRLILRPFSMEDVQPAFDNWESDKKVTKYLSWKTAKRICEVETVLANWIKNYRYPDFYQWAIVPQNFGEPIGTISVLKINESIEEMSIGYCIGSRWWGNGYAAEALSAVIAYFFENCEVKRLEAVHNIKNPNSGKVMKKSGMMYEGTLRKKHKTNKGIVDICVYSILADDYKLLNAEKNSSQRKFYSTYKMEMS